MATREDGLETAVVQESERPCEVADGYAALAVSKIGGRLATANVGWCHGSERGPAAPLLWLNKLLSVYSCRHGLLLVSRWSGKLCWRLPWVCALALCPMILLVELFLLCCSQRLFAGGRALVGGARIRAAAQARRIEKLSQKDTGPHSARDATFANETVLHREGGRSGGWRR